MPRVLSLGDLLVLAGASIGPAFSLATTMGPMVAAAGALAPAALVIATAVMACVAVAFARLVRAMPNAGSSYAWIRAAFGERAGAYAAWLLILANFFAVLATALPAGAYTLDLLVPALRASPLPVAAVACGWVVAGAVLLWAGIRPTSRVAALLLAAEVAVLAGAAAVAALHGAAAVPSGAAASAPSAAQAGWGGLIFATVVGIWMTDGWEVCASASEESRGRAAPAHGGLVGLLATAALLLACMIAYLRVGTPAGFADHSEDALAYVGAGLGGGWPTALAATVLVSIMATLQTTMLYLSRSVFAMGRDGVLPRALGATDPRGNPAAAVWAVTLGVVPCVLATGLWPSARAAYDLVLSGSAVFLGVVFMLSAAAAIRTFAGARDGRLTGVVVPGIGAVALAAILAVAVAQSSGPTRLCVAAGALLGLPLAARRAGRGRGRLTEA